MAVFATASPVHPGDQLLVTVNQACSMLSIGRTHLYKLYRRGAFDFVKLGGATRVRVADVERLAAEGADW